MTRDEIITVLATQTDVDDPRYVEAIETVFNNSLAKDRFSFECGLLRGMHIGMEIAKRMVTEQ